MFRRNKRTNAEKDSSTENNERHTTPLLKRETRHSKSIIDGKLYDTEKAELVSFFKDNRVLFKTLKGNYFSCEAKNSNYNTIDSYVSVVSYCNIRPENIEDAKEAIGKYDADRYIKLFGKPEEA